MKRLVVLSALMLGACTTVPPKPVIKPVQPVVEPEPQLDLVPGEVANSETTEAVPTDFGMIFIDQDMTFQGLLPCKGCPGVQYQLNLLRSGQFELRREYQDRNKIELIDGNWQLDDRTLHLSSNKAKVPSFQFGSNRHLILLDAAGKPTVSKDNQTLVRQAAFTKLDTRLPLLGLYQLQDNQASFTDCASGKTHNIAMTQHHLPMMRAYQTDPRLQGKPVIATLTARKSGQRDDALFVDRFDQFWPGATCADKATPARMQNLVWRLHHVSQIAVPQKLNIRVVFGEDQRMYGFSGCNNFNASYQQQDNQLRVLPVAATRKSCADGNFYEQQFTRQLQLADRIEIQHQKLRLLKDNKVIMEFLPAVN